VTEKITPFGGHRPPLQLEMAIVHFHIVPNTKTDQVVGTHGDAIKIKLRAPAVGGKANATLLNFLADNWKSQSTRSRSGAVKNRARN
jgi:uncharacterized protein (TIGR00251 family)